MATLLSDVFLDVRSSYSDVPDEQTAQGLRIANRVHREIVADYKVVTTTDYIVFDGSTREYPISENYLAVWSCNLLLDANSSPIPLEESSRDQLDQESPGWEFPQASQPTKWYLDNNSGPVLGTDWIEATPTSPATVAGFPILKYVASLYTPFTASSSIPSSLKSARIYIAGISFEWARLRGKDDRAARERDYALAKLELGDYLITKQKYNSPRVRPFFVGGSMTR